MIRSIRILLVLVSIVSDAYAQMNDSTHYYLQLSSTNSINKTNDKSAFLLNNGVRFSVEKQRIRLNFNNNWLYGKQDGNLSNNDFSSALDMNFYQTSRFFYWALLNYNTSYSLNIRNQLLAGSGVAYSFVDTETAYLNLSDGFLYDASSIFDEDIRVNYQTIRNSFRLAYKFVVREIIVFQGSNFYQPSLRNARDFNIKMNNDVSLKLNKWISLKAALTYNRINRTDRENLLFTYGVAFERFF